MHSQHFRNRLVKDVIADLQHLSGPEFEQLARLVLERTHPGIPHVIGVGLDGKPVKGKVDLVLPDGARTAFGTDADYFAESLGKPLADIAKFMKEGAGDSLVLASNRECPPTRKSTVDAALRTAAKPHTIEWWDGRRIAELVIDLQPSDKLSTLLLQWLPSLKVARSFAVMSNLVPDVSKLSGRKAEVDAIAAEILAGRRETHLFGISGVGKSALAALVARKLESSFDAIIWLPATGITNAVELCDFDHTRLGDSVNVIKACSEYAMLLVMDDVVAEASLPAVSLLGTASALLTTSQRRLTSGASASMTHGLTEQDLHTVLWHEVSDLPSDAREISHRVLETTKGHALAVSLLNRAMVVGDMSPQQVLDELSNLPHADDDTGTVLTTRLLGRHLTNARRELEMLRWVDAGTIEKSVAERLCGAIGVGKLVSRGLIEPSDGHAQLRVHDLVLLCLPAAITIGPERLANLKDQFAVMLGDLAEADSDDFVRVRNTHRGKILEEALAEGSSWPLKYTALHIDDDRRHVLASVLASAFVESKLEIAEPDRSLKLWSVIEALEIDYRHKLRSGEATVAAFERLAELVSGDESNLTLVRHHKAKILNRSGRQQEAIAEFQMVAATHHASANASRLQLARMLRTDPARAAELLSAVFDAAERGVVVGPSLLLGAIETLSYSHLHAHWKQIASMYEGLIVRAIRGGVSIGESQAVRTLGTIAGKFSRFLPDVFDSITARFAFDSLPPTLIAKDEERFRLAEIARYMAVRQREAGGDSRLFDVAVSYFESIDRMLPYHRYAFANCLLDAGLDARRAISVLQEVPSADRDAYWHVAMSRGCSAVGDAVEAYRLAKQASELSQGPQYEPYRYLFDDRLAATTPNGHPSSQ